MFSGPPSGTHLVGLADPLERGESIDQARLESVVGGDRVDAVSHGNDGDTQLGELVEEQNDLSGSAREAVQLPDDDPIHAVETRVGDEAVEGRARGPVLMLLDLLEPHAPAASFDVPP